MTYEYVKNQIELIEGYKLLSKEYINSKIKLKIKHIICNNEYLATFSHFKNKRRCPVCYGTKKLTYEYIKNQIESVKDYKLLSKEYINSKIKLKIQCNKGHIFDMIWNSFQQGQRCSVCSNNNKGYSQKLTYEHVKEQIESVKDYTFLSKKYKNSHTKLLIKCDKNHIYKCRFDHFQRGVRCSICNNNGASKAEKEIQEYIKSFNLNQSNNNRNTILNKNTNNYLELDIFLPDLKKAIEYNGKYWHSFEDVIERDKIKQKECKRLNIDLLIIHEKNYINNKEQELNKIKKFIEG